MSKKLHLSISYFLCAFLILMLPLTMGISNASADEQNAAAMSDADEGSLYVPDEIIVKFKHGIPERAIESINAQHGASVIEVSPLGFMRLSVPHGKSVLAMTDSYSKNPNVEYAEPNAICHAVMAPNDPYYKWQWHLDNNVYGGINVEDAWDISTGEGVVVAVLDTGVAYENYDDDNDGALEYRLLDDLAQTNFVAGWDFVNSDSHPNDDHWHGTHVSGTIAQSTNNSLGAAGVAFGASIMPVKVLDATGSGSMLNLANGIYYAANNGAKVINMSLAFPLWIPESWLNTVHQAIQYAYNKGVTIVAAAGNDDANQVAYPAAFEESIAVAATQYDERLAPYTNWGVALDLTAPGGNLALDQNGDTVTDGVLQRTIDPNKGPLYFSNILAEGTSMASPHVAGVAALVVALGVTGPDNVKQILYSTAEDHGGGGWDIVYGWGIVDAHKAVLAALGTPNTPPLAANDSATTSEDTPVTINVLANDSDVDGDALQVTGVSDPPHGSAAVNANNTVTYTPDINYNGTDSFTYTVIDGKGGSDTANVSITINPVNDPPVALDDSATTSEDTPVTINVLANDSDVDGDALQVTGVSDPPHGSAAVNANNTVTYTPDINYNGTDSFTYTVIDGKGGSDTATVTITVKALSASTMHVGDLDGSSVLKKRGWEASVTVTIHDNLEHPVAGATVYGKWSGAKRAVSGITGSNGTITFRYSVNSNTSVTFTVQNVTHINLTYVPSVNHDPDGDSNGTYIIVSK
jgi:serine protease